MKLKTLIGSVVLGASLCTPSFGAGLLDRMLGMRGAGCDSACCDTGCAADPSCGCEISAPACGGCADACAPVCRPGLLSRVKGRLGSSACAATCGCEISAPACGGCGSSSCDGGCSAAPSCGCEIASCDPCGCDTGCKPRRRPLMELVGKAKCSLSNLGSRRACCDSGCDPCGDVCGAPSCGCEIAAPACGGCGSSSCGGGCSAAPSCGCEIAACDPCAASCAPKCGGLLSKLFKRKNRCCDSYVSCDSGCASGSCGGGCSSCGGGSTTYGTSSAPVEAPVVHGDAAPMPPAPIVDPSAYLQSNRRVIQATSYVR